MTPQLLRPVPLILAAACLLTACPEPVPSESAPQPGGQNTAQGPQAGGPAPGQPSAPAQGSGPGASNPEQLRQADGASKVGEDRPLLDMSVPIPDLTSQEAIKSQGDYISVKGTISGDGCKGKFIRLDALEITSTIRRLMTVKELKDIGAYEMLLPKGKNPVEILAACDADGDKKIFPNKDMVGHYDQNPIPGSDSISGVDIELKKEFGPAGGNGAPAPGSVPSADGPTGATGATGGVNPATAGIPLSAGGPPSTATGSNPSGPAISAEAPKPAPGSEAKTGPAPAAPAAQKGAKPPTTEPTKPGAGSPAAGTGSGSGAGKK